MPTALAGTVKSEEGFADIGDMVDESALFSLAFPSHEGPTSESVCAAAGLCGGDLEAPSLGTVAKHEGGDGGTASGGGRSRASGDGEDSEVGATTPRRSASDLDPLVCSVCGSSSADADLTDPTSTRRTPFSRTRQRGDAVPACDHCDSLIRSARLRATTASVVVASFGSQDERMKFLRLLACFLSLKFTEASSKVHHVTFTKTMSLIESFDAILATLHNRFRGIVGDEIKLPSVVNVLGVRDYVKMYGNPIVHNEILVQAQVDDTVQVVVLTGKPIGQGRNQLASHVEGAAGGAAASSDLSKLSMMSADSRSLPLARPPRRRAHESSAVATSRHAGHAAGCIRDGSIAGIPRAGSLRLGCAFRIAKAAATACFSLSCCASGRQQQCRRRGPKG